MDKPVFLVLIDWQNLFHQCENKGFAIETAVEEIVKRVLERGSLMEIRAFVPLYLLNPQPWMLVNEVQQKYGLAVSTCPVLKKGDEALPTYKDLVDFEVLRWVMNYLYPGSGPDFAVFVTGDGHFLVAANEAKNRGKQVEFWNVDRTTVNSTIKSTQIALEVQQPLRPTQETENGVVKFLHDIVTGKESLSPDEKGQVAVIKKAFDTMSGLTRPVTVEAERQRMIKQISSEMQVSEDFAAQVIEAWVLVGAVRFALIPGVNAVVNPDHPFVRWMEKTGKEAP